MSDAPQPKLRWYQYRLRTLFVLMFAVALGMGLLATPLQRAREQRQAVEAIKKLGGSVAYDYEHDASGYSRMGASRRAQLGYEHSLGTTSSPMLSTFPSRARRSPTPASSTSKG